MDSWPVTVSRDGAVHLGPEIVADGFRRSAPVRVQTHVHHDHMTNFNRSKARQDIVALTGTVDLLVARLDADLPERTNVHGVEPGGTWRGVELRSSGHMLGAAQVSTTLGDGTRVGYSGDFSWPLEAAIQVDYLVVDATYGNPQSVRRYTQGQAEESFVALVNDAVTAGRRVYVKSHPGTLQRAISAMHDRCPVPLIASTKSVLELDVYRRHGYVFPEVLCSDGVHQDRIIAGCDSYVRFLGPGDGGRSLAPDDAVFIVTSGFMSARGGDDPVLEHCVGRSYQVALSDHADFEGTLEYVAATGASCVLVDNSRGGNGESLAANIRSELGLRASAELVEPEPWR